MKRYTKVDVAALLERIKSEGPDAVISRAEATALIASRTMALVKRSGERFQMVGHWRTLSPALRRKTRGDMFER